MPRELFGEHVPAAPGWPARAPRLPVFRALLIPPGLPESERFVRRNDPEAIALQDHLSAITRDSGEVLQRPRPRGFSGKGPAGGPRRVEFGEPVGPVQDPPVTAGQEIQVLPRQGLATPGKFGLVHEIPIPWETQEIERPERVLPVQQSRHSLPASHPAEPRRGGAGDLRLAIVQSVDNDRSGRAILQAPERADCRNANPAVLIRHEGPDEPRLGPDVQADQRIQRAPANLARSV